MRELWHCHKRTASPRVGERRKQRRADQPASVARYPPRSDFSPTLTDPSRVPLGPLTRRVQEPAATARILRLNGMRSYTMRRRNAATPVGGSKAAWSAAPPAIGRCIRWRRRGAISIRYRDERRQQQLGNGEWRVTGRQRWNPAACPKNVACIAVNAPCTAASGDPYTVSRRGVSSARNRAADRSLKVWICAMAAAESA